MNDQASTLRLISSVAQSKITENMNPNIHQSSAPDKRRTRTIAVTSGKGGVGKTNFAVNVSIALCALNKRVTLLDADMGLANADLLCGLNPKKYFGHFLENECRLDEIVMEMNNGLRLIPGSSGIEDLANFSIARHSPSLAQLQVMEQLTDFILIDCSAGIAENVIGIVLAASQVVVLTTPEPPAVVDAYAMIKVIHRHAPEKLISLVVNNAGGISEAAQIYKQLNTATKRFLRHRLDFLGAIPQDSQLVEAVCHQTPVIEYAPESASSRAMKLIARQLNEQTTQSAINRNKSFWNSLITQSQV